MEFSDWITKKYIEWRGDSIGRDSTIKAYSASLKVAQSSLTEWMTGVSKPKHKSTIDKLVRRYGYEVYDALGIPRPEIELDPDIQALQEKYLSIPPDQRQELIDLVDEFISQKRIRKPLP